MEIGRLEKESAEPAFWLDQLKAQDTMRRLAEQKRVVEQWRELARQFAERQLRTLADACDRVFSRGGLGEDAPLVGAGVGRFLVERLAGRLQRPYVGFGELFEVRGEVRADVADCAPAAAVAWLARKESLKR